MRFTKMLKILLLKIIVDYLCIEVVSFLIWSLISSKKKEGGLNKRDIIINIGKSRTSKNHITMMT